MVPLIVSPHNWPVMTHHAVTKTIRKTHLARRAIRCLMSCIFMIFASKKLDQVDNTQACSLVHNTWCSEYLTEPGFPQLKRGERQTWSSEDTQPISFKVLFCLSIRCFISLT